MRTKPYISHTRYLYILLAMLLPFFSGCIDDKDTFASTDELIKITIDAPATSVAGGSDNPQSLMENVVVLVFKVEGEKEVFAYRALASEPTLKQGSTYEIGAYLTHSKEQEEYRLVLLGNPDKKYGNLHHLKGKDKETVLKELLFDAKGSETGYDWAGKDALPLHGESDPRIIHEHTSFNDIAMTRALAKVDITLNEENSVSTEYTLEEAWSYNLVNKGYIAQIGKVKDLKKKQDPELPNLTEENYNQFIPFSNGIMLLAENKAGVADDVEETTCFVIGVSKKKADDSSKETRYYRVDLKEGETFLPILRNYHYNIFIDAITGDGADNKEDALKKEVEIDCTVHIGEWNLLENEYEFDRLDENEWLNAVDGRNFVFKDVDNGKDVVDLRFITDIGKIEKDIKRVEIDPEDNGELFQFKMTFEELEIEKAHGHTVLKNGFILSCSVMEGKWQEFTTSTQAYYAISLVVKDHKEEKEKMRVPLRIYAPKQDISEIAPNDPNFKQKIIGKYIRGTEVDATKHYIECKLAVSYLTSLGVGLEDLSIFTNTVNGYKFAKNTIETQEAENIEGFYIIKVPATGTPIKEGIDNFTLNYKFSKSVGDNQNFTTTKYTQLSNEVIVENLEEPVVENLRILFVADGYSFSEDAGSFGKHINMGRVLRGEKNFSLLKDIKNAIRVKPFEFRRCTTYYTWNFDDIPRNIIYWAKNLEEVEKILFQTDRDEYVGKWEDFDIIYYIRSSNPNELREPQYEKTLKYFVGSKDKVLVQTPSSRMKEGIFSDESYKDLLFGLKVERSSALFSNQRAITIKGSNEMKVGFPYKEGEFSNGSEFRDFNYITSENKDPYQSIADIRVVKNLAKDYPAIIRKEGDKGNHLWIGSSYFFMDKVLKATVSGVPDWIYLLTKGGWLNANGDFITIGEHREAVHNSTYFLDTMRWAIEKITENRKSN